MNEKTNKSKQKVEQAKVKKTIADDLPENKTEGSLGTKKAKPKKNPGIKKERPPFSKTALLALLIAVLVSAVAGYEFYLLGAQIESNSTLANTQNKQLSRISDLEQALQGTREALVAEVQARKNAQAEHGALNTAMQAVSAKLGRTTSAWRLAEVEYLLTVANHRLNLAKDRTTAITIFETADQRIKAIGDPALLKIRKAIAGELNALRSLSEPDLTGMALSVGSLAAGVEKLPLIHKERVDLATGQIKKKAPESWQDIPVAIWEDIKSLVVVRRHQQATEPLLPPSEAWFLYQNLQLKLEQARLSLLRRDTSLFRQNLDEASAWTKTFFDEESTAVSNALSTMSSLAKIELQPPIPDVGGSLRQLRILLSERGNAIGKK